MKLMKSCLCCSLKAGCYAVTFYTLIMVVMTIMLGYVVFQARQEYAPWSRLIDLGLVGLLLIGAFALLRGLQTDCIAWIAVWLLVFLVKITCTLAVAGYEFYIMMHLLLGTVKLTIFFRYEVPTALFVSVALITCDVSAMLIVVSFCQLLRETRKTNTASTVHSARLSDCESGMDEHHNRLRTQTI